MRDLTPYETAAMYHFHDEYAAQRGGAIEFWQGLDPRRQEFIGRMVDAITLATPPAKAPDDRFDSLVRRLRRLLDGAERMGAKRTIQRVDELLDSATALPVCITPPRLGRSRRD